MGDEATETQLTSVVFVGEGEFPDDLDRVNWGAFGFAAIWTLLYGPRRWFAALFAAFAIPVLIDNIVMLFIDTGATYRAVRPITSAAIAISLPVIAAFYAALVNRQVWERERKKFEDSPRTLANVIPLDRYRKSVSFWTRLFVALLILNWVLLAGLVWFGRTSLADALTPGVSEVALVALFIYDRVRASRRVRRAGAST